MFDCAIIGGGIVGLGTALMITRREPGLRLVVIEKEPELAAHQTGRNSGVIHSGIYYKPGSRKALFAREGSRTMVEFCREQGLPVDVCGKVIVATRPEEQTGLETLFRRGLENGLPVRRLRPEEVREIEPNVRCVAGIHVPTTGITDYRRVCQRYAELAQAAGARLMTGTRVLQVRMTADGHVLETTADRVEARFLVNCGGLHSDRLARAAGVDPGARIVPFRGEYYELRPERRDLVRTLIYPVPNPDFPFLGVHLTRMIDGSIHAGPNAVLAFRREGYTKTSFSLRDTWETLTYGGFWRLARRHWSEGCREMIRSLRKAEFARSVQNLVPAVQEEDLIPSSAGVRAQALQPDGRLVDDFLLVPGPRAMHVCNAPSPAATASLEIGRTVAAALPPLRRDAMVALGA